MGFDKLFQTLTHSATFITGIGGTAIWAIIGFIAALVFFRLLLQKSGRLPPGPYAFPIIGNLHQLRQPAHRCLKDLADKYGPIMFLRFGSVPTVVVSSPEIAKQFLKTHDLIFASRPPTAVGKYFFYNFKSIALAPYGDHWRQMRKICVLELLTARRIESFKHVREEEVSATMGSIWEKSEKGTTALNVTKAISTLTSNIIWQILASQKFSDDDLGANDKGFKDLIQEVSAASGEFNIGDFIPYLDWLDLQGIKRRLKQANKRFDAFAEKLLEDHVHDRMAATSNGREETEAYPLKDFVDVLLEMAETYINSETKMTRETIKAVLFDMFSGGMETTTTALEWAMSELLRHPHAMNRLQGEIESVVGQRGNVKESDLATMKYLHCVVKETLRLYPPLPLALPHHSIEAVTVGDYYIPKKTMLLVNLWAIGRDLTVWGADAMEFKPERFMREEFIDLTSQSDFKIFPFGSGRRGCPGSLMAIPMVELSLANLVHVFDWRVEGDPSQLDMKEASATTMPREVPLFAFPTLRLPGCL
jgi:cytochrome P450